jgi:hypothetical protein
MIDHLTMKFIYKKLGKLGLNREDCVLLGYPTGRYELGQAWLKIKIDQDIY